MNQAFVTTKLTMKKKLTLAIILSNSASYTVIVFLLPKPKVNYKHEMLIKKAIFKKN